MDTGQIKKLSKIALLALFLLFILGLLFYKERILFADASYVLFSIINHNDFAIQFGRYGSFITQLFPYLGQKLHLPLNTLMLLYGMSFYLFYLLVACLLVFWLKQYRLAIVMALFYFLFVSQSFIWISEIPQGIAWMFLFFGLTIHLGNKKANLLLLTVPFILLAFLALYTHFVIIIPTIFLWVYFIVEKKNWPFSKKTSALLSGILVAIVIIKFSAAIGGPRSRGDAPVLQGITRLSLRDILYAVHSPVIKMFIYRCATNYWISTVIFIIAVISLIRNRQKVLAGWVLLSCFGYFLIMAFTYAGFDEHYRLFHIETEWQSLGVIVATPFIFSFLHVQKFAFTRWFLVCIFAIRLIYIVAFLPTFITRDVLKEQLLGKMRDKGITKLALIDNKELQTKMFLDWALPFETVMASKLDGDDPQLTLMFVNPDNKNLINSLSNIKGMSAAWGMIINSEGLNKQYFSIDTTHPYRVMTYEEFLK